jgi:hypothetical protein
MLKSLDYFATYALILLVGSLRTIIESISSLSVMGITLFVFLFVVSYCSYMDPIVVDLLASSTSPDVEIGFISLFAFELFLPCVPRQSL